MLLRFSCRLQRSLLSYEGNGLGFTCAHKLNEEIPIYENDQTNKYTNTSQHEQRKCITYLSVKTAG